MINRSNQSSIFFLALLLLLVTPTIALSKGPLEVSYIANEGYLITSGNQKVIIDGLFREGIKPYLTSSTATRSRLEQALSPFNQVDLVLATHFHSDHFDPLAVAAHINNNPRALFISTNQSLDKLKSYSDFNGIKSRLTATHPSEGERINFTHNGIKLQVLNIHHGRNRPIENLGFLGVVDGYKFLHIGDSEASADDLKVYQLDKEGIDVAFLPYWYFLSADQKRAVKEMIKPKHIVLMHIPDMKEKDEYIDKRGGWMKVLADIKAEFPQAIYFEKELEKKSFN